MNFLGNTFLQDKYCGDPSPTYLHDLDTIILKRAIFDNLFITTDTSTTIDNPLSKEWDFNTILHAGFNGNLNAGNVEYTISQITAIRLKRRKKGTYTWTTLFEIPVRTFDDLSIKRVDRYARNNIEYEYGLIPVLGNVEGSISLNTVISKFDGVFICSKDKTYGTIFETDVTSTRHRPFSTINTLGSQFPFVTYQSKNNYDLGTATGMFINYDENCNIDLLGATDYREDLKNFLYDGKPKLLKYEDGKAWIVGIVDDIAEDHSEHPDKVITTLQWVQIGVPESSEDLYNNGLTDTGRESW